MPKKGETAPNRGQKMVDYIEGEMWKPVVGFEGLYEVSDLGRIKSLPRNSTRGGLIKPYLSTHNGYVYVGLCKSNKKHTIRLHKLVLQAFTDYDPNGGLVIDHLDGNKTNNRLDNLEAVTQKVNFNRAIANGLVEFKGEMVVDLDEMKIYKTYTEAARAVGGKQGEMVRRVCKGERSHYRNHHFATLDDFYNGTIPMYEKQITRKASESLWR